MLIGVNTVGDGTGQSQLIAQVCLIKPNSYLDEEQTLVSDTGKLLKVALPLSLQPVTYNVRLNLVIDQLKG